MAGCGRIGFSDTTQLPTDAAPFVCPLSFTSSAGGYCYLYVDAPQVDWPTAEQNCEATPGAHLAVIDGSTEAKAVVALGLGQVIWIGETDRLVEGDYRTVTGQPPYLNWEATFPMGAPDCVEINASGHIKDLDCAGNNQALCEVDGRAVVAGSF